MAASDTAAQCTHTFVFVHRGMRNIFSSWVKNGNEGEMFWKMTQCTYRVGFFCDNACRAPRVKSTLLIWNERQIFCSVFVYCRRVTFISNGLHTKGAGLESHDLTRQTCLLTFLKNCYAFSRHASFLFSFEMNYFGCSVTRFDFVSFLCPFKWIRVIF